MPPSYLDRRVNKALGEMLVDRGCITPEQCANGLQFAREHGLRLGEALIQLQYIHHDLLSYVLAEQFGERPIELDASMLDPELVRKFPYELLFRHGMLPLIMVDDELTLVVSDPNDHAGLDAISAFAPGLLVRAHLAPAERIHECLEMCRRREGTVPVQVRGDAPAGGVAPEPASPGYVSWLANLAVENPEADVLLRTGATTAILLVKDGSEDSPVEVARIEAHLVPIIRRHLPAFAGEVALTRGTVHSWNHAIRAGQILYRPAIISRTDLGGSELVFRAIRVVRGPGHATMPGSALVLYESADALAEVLPGFADSGVLFVQAATRYAFETCNTLPAGSFDLAEALTVFAPARVLFDHVPSGAAIALCVQANADIVICCPAPYDGSSLAPSVRGFLRHCQPRVVGARQDGSIWNLEPNEIASLMEEDD